MNAPSIIYWMIGACAVIGVFFVARAFGVAPYLCPKCGAFSETEVCERCGWDQRNGEYGERRS